MAHQDFEKYADVKTIVGQVSLIWEKAFYKALKERGLSKYDQIEFLDFGCGDGRYFSYLTQKGFLVDNIYGIEVSQKRIQRCKNLGWDKACLLKLKQPIPYPDKSFDIINFVEVIEHIPYSEIDFYLKEIVRVMKPNAFLILTTPNYPIKRIYDFIDAILAGRWKRLRDDPTHVCRYNKKKLQKVLSHYFSNISFSVYKEGILYKKIKKDFFLHKFLVVAANSSIVEG